MCMYYARFLDHPRFRIWMEEKIEIIKPFTLYGGGVGRGVGKQWEGRREWKSVCFSLSSCCSSNGTCDLSPL